MTIIIIFLGIIIALLMVILASISTAFKLNMEKGLETSVNILAHITAIIVTISAPFIIALIGIWIDRLF